MQAGDKVSIPGEVEAVDQETLTAIVKLSNGERMSFDIGDLRPELPEQTSLRAA